MSSLALRRFNILTSPRRQSILSPIAGSTSITTTPTTRTRISHPQSIRHFSPSHPATIMSGLTPVFTKEACPRKSLPLLLPSSSSSSSLLKSQNTIHPTNLPTSFLPSSRRTIQPSDQSRGHCVLRRPDPRRQARQPGRGNHHREDGRVHLEPQGHSRRGWLRARKGR